MKKEYCFALLTASPSLGTLAGNCRPSGQDILTTPDRSLDHGRAFMTADFFVFGTF
jgi:hypothetical protein